MSHLMHTPAPKTPTTPDPDTGGNAYESMPPSLIPDAMASSAKAALESETQREPDSPFPENT